MVQYNDTDASVYSLMPNYYTVYEIEPDTINERIHYTSQDDKYAIAYGSCGAWEIQPEDLRWKYDVN